MSAQGDKRFDATPARRLRAKREGNAARSNELSGAVSFAAATLALAAVLPLLAALAAAALRGSVTHSAGALSVVPVLACACVPAIAAAAAGTFAGLAQTGGLRIAPIRLAFSKLAPQTGLRRMAGGEAALGAARAAIALGTALVAITPVAIHVLGVALHFSAPFASADAARTGAFAACFTCAAVGALFAVGDFALARRRWLHSLRMTFDEFKRDLKEADGDPHARSRRRHLHRSIARGSVERTREASFVVVNPTHVAIALRYAPPAVPVPEILVRAVDEAALTVRSIARNAGIPIVEDVALARWLLRVGEAGAPIPPPTFVAVAEIIAALARSGVLVE